MSTLPPFTVREQIWDDNTRIDKIERYRHHVSFRDTAEGEWRSSSITCCNNCGEVLMLGPVHCATCGYPPADSENKGDFHA